MLSYFGLLLYRSKSGSGMPAVSVVAVPMPPAAPLTSHVLETPPRVTVESDTSAVAIPTATRDVSGGPVVMPIAPPPVSIPAPVTRAPATKDHPPTAREAAVRHMTREPSATASLPPLRLPATPTGIVRSSEDWVKAQAEVRAALSAWLVRSGLGDESVASDAIVILDVDGQMARTHVPMRWGGSAVTREQLWRRGPNGWDFITDREAWRDR